MDPSKVYEATHSFRSFAARPEDHDLVTPVSIAHVLFRRRLPLMSAGHGSAHDDGSDASRSVSKPSSTVVNERASEPT